MRSPESGDAASTTLDQQSTAVEPHTEPDVARIRDRSDPRSELTGERRPWRIAAILVAPLLLLCVVWALSNPPGAAPDEPDHLIKALGSASLSIGSPGPPAPVGASKIQQRNASITRIYNIPANLMPEGYTCFAFNGDATAKCLPPDKGQGSGTVKVATPIGAYPPFLYVPIGLAAHLAVTPSQAFLLARLMGILMSMTLIFLAAGHLARWLGRRSVIGLVIALTPMSLYVMSVVTTSGIEISAACAVAAVAVVAIHRPDSVFARETHWVLAAAGSTLALSRQLGAVALAFLLLVLLSAIGWRRIRQLVIEHRVSFIACVILLLGSSIAVASWELKFDQPANVGPVLDRSALRPFVHGFYGLMQSGIGKFGWLDTPLPNSAIAFWVVLWVLILGIGLIGGNRREAWTIFVGLIVTISLAFAIYASVFFTITADIQGRQFLPIFALCPILGGTVLGNLLPRLGRGNGTRVFVPIAVGVAVMQLLSIYWNGRRYATGLDGPLWFLPDAQWSPPLGWALLLILTVLASVTYAVIVICYRPVQSARDTNDDRRVEPRVERENSRSHTSDI